jgi:hypothetical protein
MAKAGHTFELTISIRNRSKKKLDRLRQWLMSALDDWKKDDEVPMQGTDWDYPTEFKEVEDDW